MSEPAKTLWRLVIDVGAGGFRDKVVITDPDRNALQGVVIERDGEEWVRYGDLDDYVEVRKSSIQIRSFHEVDLEQEKNETVESPGAPTPGELAGGLGGPYKS